MCRVSIDFVSPSGVPVTLEVGPDDEQQTIIAVLERADKIAAHFLKHGWATAAASPQSTALVPYGAAPQQAGPTFAGFPCSPTVDAQGLPTWIMVDGKQAQRREKQGDVWYSAKMPDGTYAQVLRIPKGEKAPAVMGM